jgi:hypothetical protein
MEFHHLTANPKAHNIVDTTETDDEEAIATLDGQLLSSIVSVVSEVDFYESMLGSLYELKASGRKSKSASWNKALKRVSVLKSKIVS